MICPFTVLATVPAAPEADTLWQFILKGGFMMVPIGICSLVGLTVIAERFWSLRRPVVSPTPLALALKSFSTAGGDDPDTLGAKCRANDSPLARVISAGLRRWGAERQTVRECIQETGEREIMGLRRNLRALSVIAAVAPLMGLLGTIFGMINAFQTVAMRPDALGKTEQLAGGIYEAMITTAGGLVVAIPAVIFYHWLAARVQRRGLEIDEYATEFMATYGSRGKETREAAVTPSLSAASALR